MSSQSTQSTTGAVVTSTAQTTVAQPTLKKKPGERYSSKTVAGFLFSEMVFAMASLLGYIHLTDHHRVSIYIPGVLFMITSIVLTVYLTLGRETYPSNVVAYHCFLCSTLIFVFHLTKYEKIVVDVYHLVTAMACCLAGAITFLVVSFLPLCRIRKQQLLYALPPIMISEFYAAVLSQIIYTRLSWASISIVPLVASIMIPSAFVTTMMIKHYILCVC